MHPILKALTGARLLAQGRDGASEGTDLALPGEEKVRRPVLEGINVEEWAGTARAVDRKNVPAPAESALIAQAEKDSAPDANMVTRIGIILQRIQRPRSLRKRPKKRPRNNRVCIGGRGTAVRLSLQGGERDKARSVFPQTSARTRFLLFRTVSMPPFP